MKNIILFDTEDTYQHLLPFSYTRPIADIRIGILTIAEKWRNVFAPCRCSYITADYLATKFPVYEEPDSIFIAGNVMPDHDIIKAIHGLSPGEGVVEKESGLLIAMRGSRQQFDSGDFTTKEFEGEIFKIRELYDIFLLNGKAMDIDFRFVTAGRASQPVSATNVVIGNPFFPDGSSKIFIEEGAKVEGVFLNVDNGPIYIGRDAEIMETSCIRAPFAACEHSVVNMGTRIYGATTLGPYCKVGGELNNVVMIGFSNKAHDGFLGNSVIGEWCNLGGGTTASNLKNDYSEIKLWNYAVKRFARTGLQFCGLMMGDHSKSGINSMFNTATVIGVGCNIYGSGFPRNFVPSFSEGSPAGYINVSLSRFFAIAERMMARRNKTLSDIDRKIFEDIYQCAEKFK